MDLRVSVQEMVPQVLYEQVLAENTRLTTSVTELSGQLRVALVRIEELEARGGGVVEELQQAAELGRADQASSEVVAHEVGAGPGRVEGSGRVHVGAGRRS